mmetsp:Transcript_35203/g.92303  ORF Transcript_35203/g.92303 Transcript_35203/m.92303 type:complete len:272 (+) Transcript_35203:53-868(+)
MLACGVVGSAAFAPAVAPRSAAAPRVSVQMETLSDLKTLASGLNPVVGYWDPLKLAEAEFWDNTNEETIGWLRHAEIKHGRVAMAGFVGYLVHAQHIHFPWTPYPGFDAAADALLSPPEQWDAVPYNGKLQILLAIGFLEWWSEIRVDGTPHYMKGGKPGYYPTFDLGEPAPGKTLGWGIPHPCPFNLYDPFNLNKNRSDEAKANGLLVEINNGRLAMLGIMGFLAESKVEGAVPALTGIVKPYAGEVMAPFAATDAGLPYVADMLKYSLF